jgi:hypothetical protein
MGTSRPKPDAPPGSPLIPPWADQDPAPPVPLPEPLPDDPVPDPEADPGPPADEVVDEDDASAVEIAEPRRYAGFRTSLRRFRTSGDRNDARTALRHWATRSVGGGTAGARRLARAARTGGAVLAGLGRAGAGQGSEAGALDIRALAGRPIATAIAQIIDAFMPPGILDEVAARISMELALASTLGSADTFDPAALDANAVRIATQAFVTELVFVQVAGDAGPILAAVGPVLAAQREVSIRSLIREVVDVVAGPILTAADTVLSSQRMAALVSQLVRETLSEIASW